MARRLRKAIDEAEAFVGAMPAGKEGLLFLEDGKPVQPEPEKLADYVEHAGRRRGYWPSSAEIGGNAGSGPLTSVARCSGVFAPPGGMSQSIEREPRYGRRCLVGNGED